jgi:hypothetical protein
MGLQDPDPLIRGMDPDPDTAPDPDPSIIMQKILRKTLILFDFLCFKNDVNVASKRNKHKKLN